MMTCPYCQETTRQNKAGTTNAGSQRYRCMHCNHKYT
ncbi:MAG: IS1 family transposase, partial [Chloroflexi bacterium]|nr:IS1 family transposase [Chloroflexota bacterium]